jgi:hypothetical protein
MRGLYPSTLSNNRPGFVFPAPRIAGGRHGVGWGGDVGLRGRLKMPRFAADKMQLTNSVAYSIDRSPVIRAEAKQGWKPWNQPRPPQLMLARVHTYSSPKEASADRAESSQSQCGPGRLTFRGVSVSRLTGQGPRFDRSQQSRPKAFLPVQSCRSTPARTHR